MNNFTTSQLASYVWSTTQSDVTVGKRAMLTSLDPEVRQAACMQVLNAEELSILGSRPLSEDELHHGVLQYTVGLDSIDDVRILALQEDCDRSMRRALVTKGGYTYRNTTQAEQHDLCLELDPCDGLDDIVIGLLPYWVADDFHFDVKALLPKMGPIAASHMLASTGPELLTDDEVWEWITNPPERWHHETREWHQRTHVRDAISMVLTHRPNLVARAAEDPYLVERALATPHWKAEYAYRIRGLDLESSTLTSDASMNTPGMLLSLVWNPKTPLKQAESIHRIASEAVNTSPYVSDWKITRSASERRIASQPGHVDDYETVSDTEVLERISRRISRGLIAHQSAREKLLNGAPATLVTWWPKRFAELAAIQTNTAARHVMAPTFGAESVWNDTPVPPKGTWTFTQFEATNHVIVEPGRYAVRDQTPKTLQLNRALSRLVQHAATEFEKLPEEDQLAAWNLMLDILADTDELVPPVDSVIDTVVAVLS